MQRHQELIAFLTHALIGGIILGYNDLTIYLRILPPDTTRQLVALSIAIISITIALLIHHTALRSAAARRGIDIFFTYSPIKLLTGILIAIFSMGFIPLPFPPDVQYTLNRPRRLSRKHTLITLHDSFWISFAGIMANILTAALLKLVLGLTPPLASGLIVANLAVAVAAAVPLPRSPSFFTLYKHPLWWILLFGFALGGASLLISQPIIGLIIASLTAIIAWFLLATQSYKLFSID